jgi:hypothetical protein
VTRDPTGNPGAEGARNPRRPPGRQRPHAATGPFPRAAPPYPVRTPDTRVSGDAGSAWPRPAVPPYSSQGGGFGSVPGNEFEGRRPPSADQPRLPRAGYEGSGFRALRGPVGPEHPGVPLRDADGQPRRFRYTPTVSQSLPVPQSAWPRDQLPVPYPAWPRGELPVPYPARPGDQLSVPYPAWPRGELPGFEFDGRAPFAAGLTAADPWDEGDEFLPAGTVTRPARAVPAAARPHLAAARTEWVRLLRSFLPEPARRNWFSEFRSALAFRGLTPRVAIPILAMIVFGVSVVVLAKADGSPSGPPPAPTSLGFPPATLAGGEFAVADSGRGISQTLGQVTSDGAKIVAVGSQAGARIARAQFFVSTDDGRSWAMGTVRTPDGGPPPPGYAARFVAGGRGQWVAIGPDAIWTSADGRSWTLSSTAGLPLHPGDQISVLDRTAAGFMAAGANAPGGDEAKASPVVFLSANGVSWRRLGAGQLGLTAGTGRVLGIRYAAVYGNRILIAGDVAEPAGRPGRAGTVPTSAAWLSSDGGTTWALAVPPARALSAQALSAQALAGHGARAQISGAAATGDGFVLVRPASVGGRPAADVYLSRNGTAWTFEATLGTPAGFAAATVNGGPDGAVVAGPAGRTLTAFMSANGASWQRTPAFGSTASQSVSGVTMADDGTVVTAGTTTNDPDSRQPLLTVLGPAGTPDHVAVTAIPGAVDPQLAVNSIAAGNGRQVAVGSANGYPAAWTSADGGSTWTRAVGQTQAVLDRPGFQQLTSVTYGPAGWLAVGAVTGVTGVTGITRITGVTAVAAEHPVVIGSADGIVWQAADDEAAFAGPGLFTEQASAGPGGYVIVGYQVISGRTVAAAWWSSGLAAWRRASGALQAGASSQMLAVSAGPHRFVAVGSDGSQPSAWTSPDGRDWTRESLPLPVGATRAVLQQVAANGRNVAAVGTAFTTTGQQVPFAAGSSDGGAAWTEAVLPVPSGHASATALAWAGNGFIATGTFGRTPGHQDVLVWTSASGSAWQAATPTGPGLTGPGIQAITGLTVSGGTLSGVGYTATPAGEQPVFWQSPIR